MEKILLILLPFWTPLIPPIGIACLKRFLTDGGYQVKTIDASVEDRFKRLYQKYFNTLAGQVPENKQGNFYSLGHDVLRNHMMACMDEAEQDGAGTAELIKQLVYNTFYVETDHHLIAKLNEIVKEFYRQLHQYLLQLVEKETPEVFGLSVFSDTLPASIFAFQKIKQNFPRIKTVMGGGVFSDLLAEKSENFSIFLKKTSSYIDKIFIGEGEYLFLAWLSGRLPNSQRVYTLKDINHQTLDLSSAGVPDLSDFDIKKYPYLVSYTSRSCPFQCKFCSETLQWGKFRKKQAGQVVRELTTLYETYKDTNSRLFLLSDSLLNPVINHLSCEFINSAEAPPVYWGGWLRAGPQACTRESTGKWRQGGFYHARIGVESGSQRILDLMGKQVTIEQIRQTISNLANTGIKTTTLWVIGYPGETETDFMQTLELIKQLRNDIYEAECRPFYYYETGQVGSADWWNQYKRTPLYSSPPAAADMLMLQTYILDCEPSRQETYQRVNRFVRHCKELDIPNPYSMQDIYAADERWKQLHKNAVPSIIRLTDGIDIDVGEERKNVTFFNAAVNKKNDQGDFIF